MPSSWSRRPSTWPARPACSRSLRTPGGHGKILVTHETSTPHPSTNRDGGPHDDHRRRRDDCRFGIFLAPFHPVDENPTLAIQRDLELVERLDQLGYDEAWIGEHHSAGYEIIARPEVFIAAAAERTSHIRLGTGVSSLPYHHPFMLADRINQLDHMTRGRVMFGVGPGRAAVRRLHDGHRPGPAAGHDGRGARAILALLPGEERSARRPTGSS